MFKSNDWFCGQNASVVAIVLQGLGNSSSINDPCFVDGYYLIVSAVFVSLSILVLLFMYSRSGLRNFNRAFIVRYPCHCTRWLLGIVLCHTQFTSIGEGILTAVSTRPDSPSEPHLYLPQTLALITVIAILSYYHHMEVWNLWPMVFLPLAYWIMGLSSEILRYLNIHQDTDAVENTMRGLLCLTNLILYTLLTVIEIYTTLYLLFCPSGRPRDIGPIDLKRQGKSVKFVQGHTNFASGILFWWMNDIVKLGSKRSLNPEDFGDLPRSLTAGPNATQFYKHMYDNDGKDMVTTQPSIFRAYRSIYGLEFLESAFAKGISDALSFIPALAVGGMVDYVISQSEADSIKSSNPMEYITVDDFLANGFVLLIISTLSVVIKGFFLQYSNYILYQQTIKIKGSLQSIIYDKSLRLSTSSPPESLCGVGEIANRVFVDTDNIQSMFTYIHNVWSIPVQVALSLMFLYMKMGVSALIGASIMLVIFPIQMALARVSVFFQKRAMARSDDRLRAINEVVQGMKLVKLLGWEDLFYKIITKCRNLQVYMLRRQAVISSIIIPLGFVSPSFIALLSFSMYSLVEGMTLTPDIAFTVIPLIQNLSAPLLLLQPTINQVVGGIVSMRRIEKFLASPEIEKNDAGRSNKDTFSTLVKKEILINEGNRLDEHELNAADHENISFGQEATSGSSYGSFAAGGGGRPTLPEKMRSTLPDDIVLKVTNASFRWDVDSTEPILSGINIEIPRSRLTIIVGEVGSGKSSLLSAALGEMYTTEGGVMWNTPYSSIAYSSQEAWLRNATVKDNIIFNSEYDITRYQQVISACALLPDIQILPAGNMTEIGEKGINLSGGQRQRISVARALYNENQVVLLDDPMSALDVHVGAHVFENGIKKWLLGNKRTVILVTHQLQYLPFADQIIVMKNGRIQLQGTFEEVASQDKMLYENWKKTMKEISETETEDEEDTKTKRERRKLKIQLKMSKIRRVAEKSTSEKDTDLGMTEFGDATKSGLIEKEERNTGSVDKGLYLYYVRMVGYALTVVCLLSFVLETFLSIYSNVWLSLYTETSVESANKTQEQLDSELDSFLRGYTGFIMTAAVMTMVSTFLSMNGLLSAANKVHRRMLSKILHAYMRFFDTTPVGRILNRFSSDMQVLDQKMLNMLPFHIRTAMLVIGGLIVNAAVSYIFVVTIIPITIAYYFLLKYYLSASRDSKRIESITRSPVYSHFGETINGLDSVRAFQEQVPFLQRLVVKIDHNSTILLFQQVLTLWLSVRLSAVGSLIILSSGIATLIPGSLGYLESSLVGLAITYAISMSTFLSVIVQRMAQIETMMNAMERSQRWTNLENEPQGGIAAAPTQWPHSGAITLESMSVRYAPGLDTVLQDINIDIRPGQKVGICGRTGSGKSSLTLALFRIIDTFRGRIIIDGIDIAQLPLHSLRKRLAIIPQDPVLFSGTIRFNLDPDSLHSDQELWEALEIAQMKKVVADLGSGLHSPVFEGGENFSVGQRQLFCLARAFLIKTKVLVMDEATASIDVRTDAVLQEVVRRVFKDRTVLTIAHRVSTILDSDVIVVLSDGQVIEYDSPDRLLQRNSVFASLVKSNK